MPGVRQCFGVEVRLVIFACSFGQFKQKSGLTHGLSFIRIPLSVQNLLIAAVNPHAEDDSIRFLQSVLIHLNARPDCQEVPGPELGSFAAR